LSSLGWRRRLHVALHGVGEEVVVGAQLHDRLQPADAREQVAHVLDGALDLVDERLVFGEAPHGALAAIDARGHVVGVLEHALERLAGAVDALDGRADLALLRGRRRGLLTRSTAGLDAWLSGATPRLPTRLAGPPAGLPRAYGALRARALRAGRAGLRPGALRAGTLRAGRAGLRAGPRAHGELLPVADHLLHVVGGLPNVGEDGEDVGPRAGGDGVDVVDRVLDAGAVLFDRLVELLGDLGQVLEDARDLVLPLGRADRVLERLGDGLHVFQDVGDLPLQALERGLVEQPRDLPAVGDLLAAVGARHQHHVVLADEAGRALADGRVDEQRHVGVHLDLDARAAALEADVVDHADLDAADHHARARGHAGDVGQVGVDAVAVARASITSHEAITPVGGPREHHRHEADLRGVGEVLCHRARETVAPRLEGSKAGLAVRGLFLAIWVPRARAAGGRASGPRPVAMLA
jgi:hypothetical protein